MDNDNLPMLNTITLDLFPAAERYVYGVDTSHRPILALYLNGGSVHVESEIDLTVDNVTGRSFDITSGAAKTIYLPALSALPEEAVKRCITISGDIYQIRNLYSKGDGIMFDFSASVENGLGSAKYFQNCIVYGGGISSSPDRMPDAGGNVIRVISSIKDINLDSLPAGVAILSSTKIYMPTSGGSYIKGQVLLSEGFSEKSSVTGIGLRCRGDVANLPKNVKVVNERSSSFTGAFEDYVDRVKAERPSGVVAIFATSNDTLNNITVNGTSLGSYVANGQYVTYSGRTYVVITWNNDTIAVDKTAWTSDLGSIINSCMIAD